MKRIDSFYKSNNILNETYRNRIFNYFNPYGYNLESNLKDRENTDITYQKSRSHTNRNNIKK